MGLNYTQWILPQIRCRGYNLEVRINRNSTTYDLSGTPTQVVTLDHKMKLWTGKGVSALKSAISNSDGNLSLENLDLEFLDVTRFTGVSNSVAVSEYLGVTAFKGNWSAVTAYVVNDVVNDPINTDWKWRCIQAHTNQALPLTEFATNAYWVKYNPTLLTQIFQQEEDGVNPYLYTVWVTLLFPSGTDEIRFRGTINATTIPFKHGLVHKPHTTTEEIEAQEIKILVTSCAEVLKSKTAAHVEAAIGSSDCLNSPGHLGWYHHIVGGTVWDAYDHYNEFVTPGGYGRTIDTVTTGTFETDGIWWIKVTKILEKIASEIGFTFNASTGLNPGFHFYQPEIIGPTASNPHYKYVKITDEEKFYVNYNYLFGKSPLDWSNFTCPITWTPETTTDVMLKDLCRQFGCYLKLTLNASGVPVMSLEPEQLTSGAVTLPSNWKLMNESSEEPREISKNTVQVTNKGSDVKLLCPENKGEQVEIQIPFRVHPWGWNTAGDILDVFATTYNSDWKQEDQYWAWTFADGRSDGAPMNESWVAAAFLYVYSITPPYPTIEAHAPGPVCVGLCLPYNYSSGADITDNDLIRRFSNTQYGPAQFWAQRYLGNRKVIKRKYRGVLTDAGSSVGIGPNMEASWLVRGQVVTFRAIEVEQDLVEGTTSIKWVEKNDYDPTLTNPTFSVGKGEASGGVSGTGTSTGGSVGDGDNSFVAISPATAARNDVTPTTSTAVGYGFVHLAASTAHVLHFRASNGTTNLLTLQYDGDLLVGKQAFNTQSTVGGDPANTLPEKGYVDAGDAAALAGAVAISPGTAARNKILATDNAAVPLIIREKTGSSVDQFRITNNGETVKYFYVTNGGDIFAERAISINVTGDRNVLTASTDATTSDVINIANSGTKFQLSFDWRVGVGAGVVASVQHLLKATADGNAGYVFKWNSGSQTGQAFQVQNNSGTVLAMWDKDGNIGTNGRTTAGTSLDVGKAYNTRRGANYTVVAGNNNDIQLPEATYIHIVGPAGTTITGIDTSGIIARAAVSGKVLILQNMTLGNLTLAHASVLSLATNQLTFAAGAGQVLVPSQIAAFIYDDAQGWWVNLYVST